MPVGQLAPAGTALRASEIAGWFTGALRSSDAAARLRDAFCERYDVRHAYLLSSGRAATYLLLRMLARMAGPARNEVIVPAYTCYSVAATVVRAGLRVRVCDIDPDTLSYDVGALAANDFRSVLAVITANLYGIPNDLPAIEKIAKDNGVYLIDDAAQSLDARIAGRAVGTFGDVGLYSFDKGKNITSIQGGVIVTNSEELAKELDNELAALPSPPALRTLMQTAQQLAYALLLRPSLYWMPASLPFLKLGETMYTTEYPVERYSSFLAPLVAAQFRRIDRITAQRAQTARQIQEALAAVPGVRPIRLLPTAQPVYPRVPLLAADPDTRSRLLHALQTEGLGATGSYPHSIAEIPELRPHLSTASSATPVGRRVASTILTLPTHYYVTSRHIAHMGAVAGKILSRP